jgi:hypothetical protein
MSGEIKIRQFAYTLGAGIMLGRGIDGDPAWFLAAIPWILVAAFSSRLFSDTTVTNS